ncbi:MAG: hypothetical protein NVSMB6_27080 [Burkholderiaceae bacterium]
MLCFQLKEATMARTETITTTMREVDQLKTVESRCPVNAAIYIGRLER